jgi:hypothetical protein
MGEVKRSLPVQLVVGLIVNPAEGFGRVREALVEAWGAIDMESPAWPFVWTDYYEGEMGKGLVRQFAAFEKLVEVDGLHRTKIASNEMERAFEAVGDAGKGRRVNIDPGYICHSKLVLFSTKDFAHRIYVGEGIFAESTLEWRGGRFTPHAWTFPDYRTEEYRNFLTEVRGQYVRKLKSTEYTDRFDSGPEMV